MSEYLLSIVGAILLSAVLTSILPEGKTLGMVKSVAKLVCVLVILSPFGKWLKNPIQITENYFSQSVIKIDESFIEYCRENAIAQAEEQIEEEILQNFLLQSDVEFICKIGQDDGVSVTQMIVRIKGGECQEVEKYLTEKYGYEVRMESWT